VFRASSTTLRLATAWQWARHYADIPALRHVHERTITEALHEALEAGLKPRLVPPDIEAAARLDPEVAGLSVALAQVSAILDGDQDVWLASCTGLTPAPSARWARPVRPRSGAASVRKRGDHRPQVARADRVRAS
jgi:hypothetical protein